MLLRTNRDAVGNRTAKNLFQTGLILRVRRKIAIVQSASAAYFLLSDYENISKYFLTVEQSRSALPKSISHVQLKHYFLVFIPYGD